MNELISIVLATLFVSCVGFVGIFILLSKKFLSASVLRILLSVSSGVLLGEVFLHLLPEGVELLEIETFSMIILVTILIYFAFEKIVHWHTHDTDEHAHLPKSAAVLSLVGDAIHNFVDGLVIAGAFIASPALGISTTLAIISHEIPQELSDFAILIGSGMSKRKAILSNFLVALTALAGGLVGFFLNSISESISTYAIPVAIGGFLYIAVSDLLPSLKEEPGKKQSIMILASVIFGVLIMTLMG